MVINNYFYFSIDKKYHEKKKRFKTCIIILWFLYRGHSIVIGKVWPKKK